MDAARKIDEAPVKNNKNSGRKRRYKLVADASQKNLKLWMCLAKSFEEPMHRVMPLALARLKQCAVAMGAGSALH